MLQQSATCFSKTERQSLRVPKNIKQIDMIIACRGKISEVYFKAGVTWVSGTQDEQCEVESPSPEPSAAHDEVVFAVGR